MSTHSLLPVERYASPFHEGELEVQRHAGTDHSALELGSGMIRSKMGPSRVDFLQHIHVLSLGALDSAGRPHATLVFGRPGFVKVEATKQASYVVIRCSLAPGDSLQSIIRSKGSPVGLLGVDFVSRGRARVNAVVESSTEEGDSSLTVKLRVLETYGNCPKYIQQRVPDFTASAPQPQLNTPDTTEHKALSPSQQALVKSADTFFIATGHSTRGADSSHRGGLPGFVRVGDTGADLWWPDYEGNGLFNTLGNIQATGFASLVFVDWPKQSLLQVSGQARIEWLPTEQSPVDTSRRLVHLAIDSVRYLSGAVPFLYKTLGEDAEDYMSPFNPNLTGVAAAVRYDPLHVRMVKRERITPDITTFWFAVPEPTEAHSRSQRKLIDKLLCHVPGEYVTFQLPIATPASGSATRTWTISSMPSCLSDIPTDPTNRRFSITVKRERRGLASRWLHDHLQVNHTEQLFVTAVAGGHTMSAFMQWPVKSLRKVFDPVSAPSQGVVTREDIEDILRNVAYGKMVMITAGIGLTPIMSSLRSLRQLNRLLRVKHAAAAPLPSITFAHSSRTRQLPHEKEVAELLEEGILSKVVWTVTGTEDSKGHVDPLQHLQSTASPQTRVGRFDSAAYDDLLPADRVVSVFMCGPAGFMHSTQHSLLHELRLPPGFLHQEAFAF